MKILSLNRLAIVLGISRDVLVQVSENKTKYYRPYLVPEKKRDGTIKERRIDNPKKAIRKIQKRINKVILRPACNELPDCMTGCIPGRSVRDNARPHVGQEAILAVDISNCFPSISASRVYDIFRSHLDCSPPVSKVLTKLTTYGDRLPQGAPTSPSLCNLVLHPLVVDVLDIAESNGLGFTQYVDDLTFSGSKSALLKAKPKIIRSVKLHGFAVNESKLKVLGRFERMEVTGLVVNTSVGVGRHYIRRVERDILHLRNAAQVKGKISHVRSVSQSKANRLTAKFKSRYK